MAAIHLLRFAGRRPRMGARLLNNQEAGAASDCDLGSGELRAWADDRLVLSRAQTGIQAIHRDSAGRWLLFPYLANVVRAPLADDPHERLYVSGGDFPRVLSADQRAAGSSGYRLGIPAPLGQPYASTPLHPITAVDKLNPLRLTSANHNLTTGNVLVFHDTGLGIDGVAHAITVLDADTFSVDGVDGTALTGTLDARARYTFRDVQTRAYVYTYVSAWGEEGPPSLPSALVDVGPTEPCNISSLQAPPVDGYQIDRIRLYRIATGSTGASYRFVMERAVTDMTLIQDTVTDAALGETLPSEDWLPPPTDLRGLIALPGGVLAGFSGQTVCFSEPYQPHAWPLAYQLTVDAPIVALGAFGNTVAVLTGEYPYLVSGSHPAAMSLSVLRVPQACVSARGVVSTTYGVLYPSPDGLILLGPGGVQNLTEAVLSREDWQKLRPDTLVGAVQDNRYFGFYLTQGLVNGVPVGAGFVLDRLHPEATLTDLADYASACYSDPLTDHLYLARPGASTTRVVQWAGGQGQRRYTWRSKPHTAPSPINLAALKVVAAFPRPLSTIERLALEASRADALAINRALLLAQDDLQGPINAQAINALDIHGDTLAHVPLLGGNDATVTLRLYGDGVLRAERTISHGEPVRLPAGYRAIDWEIELTGLVTVREVHAATSLQTLGVS